MRAQIVIVTPESAVSKAFGSFLNDLEGRRELVRIMYNKYYTVIDSTPDFRPQMRQLRTLLTRGVQIVFLTATLLPCIQSKFTRIIKINPCKVYMFRAPTTCINITYLVFKYNTDEDETNIVCQLI